MSILSLRDITFAYGEKLHRARAARAGVSAGAGREVLHELSLDIPSGVVTALLGPNGAGKTTLLNICLGWLRPRDGEVRFQAQPVGSFSRREMGRRMALVPQSEHIPFEYSILEFVLLGRAPYLAPLESPGEEDIGIAVEMIERVGLGDRMADSVLATSAGEKQLVLLARSLTQQPELLLLDEPSAHLDLRNKRRLIELLAAEVARGCSVLLTAHEPEFAAAVASHIVLMRRGRLVTHGPVGLVITTDHLSQTYETPVDVRESGDRLAFFW